MSESKVTPLRAGRVVITGGAGFLGCNIADALARRGEDVLVVDNLSRPRVRENLAWLRRMHPKAIAVEIADVRDTEAMMRAIDGASAVIHLAAQVAVTTSLVDPVSDFEINARGTLNILEAIRAQRRKIPLLFASTNKVYGECRPDGGLIKDHKRYHPRTNGYRGFDEATPLDFHSPYGCSKGVADQYVLDYGRVYGSETVVFRMSCLFGPHQFGLEDQGWVAHFAIQALTGSPVTIYGDGCQVRDALYVDDAVEAYLTALDHIDLVKGRAYNLGGGISRTLSLRELMAQLEGLTGTALQTTYADWRPGDQAWYVSDTARFERAAGWTPKISTDEGLTRLVAWLRPHFAAAERDRALP